MKRVQLVARLTNLNEKKSPKQKCVSDKSRLAGVSKCRGGRAERTHQLVPSRNSNRHQRNRMRNVSVQLDEVNLRLRWYRQCTLCGIAAPTRGPMYLYSARAASLRDCLRLGELLPDDRLWGVSGSRSMVISSRRKCESFGGDGAQVCWCSSGLAPASSGGVIRPDVTFCSFCSSWKGAERGM